MVALSIILTSISVSAIKWPCDLDSKRHLSNKPACVASDSSDGCLRYLFLFQSHETAHRDPFSVWEQGKALKSFVEQM